MRFEKHARRAQRSCARRSAPAAPRQSGWRQRGGPRRRTPPRTACPCAPAPPACLLTVCKLVIRRARQVLTAGEADNTTTEAMLVAENICTGHHRKPSDWAMAVTAFHWMQRLRVRRCGRGGFAFGEARSPLGGGDRRGSLRDRHLALPQGFPVLHVPCRHHQRTTLSAFARRGLYKGLGGSQPRIPRSHACSRVRTR